MTALAQRDYDEAYREAQTMVRTAPYCGHHDCGRLMVQDHFNGMFHCWNSGHGGYQTQDQVTHLHYAELVREMESR